MSQCLSLNKHSECTFPHNSSLCMFHIGPWLACCVKSCYLQVWVTDSSWCKMNLKKKKRSLWWKNLNKVTISEHIFNERELENVWKCEYTLQLFKTSPENELRDNALPLCVQYRTLAQSLRILLFLLLLLSSCQLLHLKRRSQSREEPPKLTCAL